MQFVNLETIFKRRRKMKKLLSIMVILGMVFCLSATAGAITYYEEYSGSQLVTMGQTYDFGFDFWFSNPPLTNSSLALTADAEGAFDSVYPWVGANLYMEFFSNDFANDEASVTLTAWNGAGGVLNQYNLGTFDISNPWPMSATTGITLNLTDGMVADFAEWGWGNVSIGAYFQDITDLFFPNDFVITKVAMEVSAVPEPGTILLLGCGLLGLATYRRRMIKK